MPPDTAAPTPVRGPDLRYFATSLLKGVIYQSDDARVWCRMLELRPDIIEFVGTLGFSLIVDETEGYAYLKSRPDDEDEDASPKPPRLVVRRALPFQTSLLLALLRKRLAELDVTGGETRLVVSRDDIVEMMRVFLPATTNQAKLVNDVTATINHVQKLGFVRPLASAFSVKAGTTFEVNRILKAFVDGQWLSDFNDRLEIYRVNAANAANAASEPADD